MFRVKTVPDLTTLHYSFEHAVADVVGGFRSALDKLAWRLACDFPPTGEPPDPTGVHFPIRDSISDFQARERRASSQVSSTVWQFFESFQPYLERNGRADAWSGLYVHPLSLLRDLSNDDKHRDTQPVLLIPNQFALPPVTIMKTAKVLGGGTTSMMPDWEFLGVGDRLALDAEVLRVRLAPDTEPQIEDAGYFTPQVALQERRPAIPTLDRLARYVQLIFTEFSRQFP